MKLIKKKRLLLKTLSLSLAGLTTTLAIVVWPTLTEKTNQSVSDFTLSNQRFEQNQSNRYQLQFNSGISQADLDYTTKHTNWKANFEQLQTKFKDNSLNPQQLGVIDVYNLLSGLEQSTRDTVKLINDLNAKVLLANAVFPVHEAFQLPQVPEQLFTILDSDFFPQLTPKGLNVTENITTVLQQYKLQSIALKQFDLKLEKQPDIVKRYKMRYSFVIQWDFETVYTGVNSTTNLAFSVKAMTTNFANLQELQDSLVLRGQNLTTQLFWKPTVKRLVLGNNNDLTTVAKAAVGDNLFTTQANLTKSVLDQTVLKEAESRFEATVLKPFIEARQKALAEHQAHQKVLEEQRQKQLEELKQKQKEAE